MPENGNLETVKLRGLEQYDYSHQWVGVSASRLLQPFLHLNSIDCRPKYLTILMADLLNDRAA